jgi:hypothetical protein
MDLTRFLTRSAVALPEPPIAAMRSDGKEWERETSRLT